MAVGTLANRQQRRPYTYALDNHTDVCTTTRHFEVRQISLVPGQAARAAMAPTYSVFGSTFPNLKCKEGHEKVHGLWRVSAVDIARKQATPAQLYIIQVAR